MQRVLKNYSLYAEYLGKKCKIYSGTLKEIDDFTTYFMNKDALTKRLIKDDFSKCIIYVESSRGTLYRPIYFNNRAILDNRNFDRIYKKIEEINKEEIVEYLYNNTKVNEYLKSDKSKNIPVVNLYLSIKNCRDYKGMLYHCLKTDYKLYRGFIIHFFENENLNMNDVNILNSRKKEILNLLLSISEEYIELENNSKKTSYNNIDLEDRIFTIMTSKELTIDEKMIELDMLVNSIEEKKQYILKYQDKLTEEV